MKKCTKCGENKVLSAFHQSSSTKDGRRQPCAVCRSTSSTRRLSYEKDVDRGLKTCSVCAVVKKLCYFQLTVRKNGTKYFLSLCKKCNKKRREDFAIVRYGSKRSEHLVKRYGITEAEFEELKYAQNGKCALCLEVPSRRLVVDHSHVTGKVRGLLCDSCNSAIGKLKEDPELFIRAIQYLQKGNM